MTVSFRQHIVKYRCDGQNRQPDIFIRKVRPQKENLWYLQGVLIYHPDGTYEFM